MNETIKTGDRYKVKSDIDVLKADQIVVIDSIVKNAIGIDVTFEGFPENYFWSFPHPFFERIYPDSIQPKYVQFVGRVKRDTAGFDQYSEFDKIVEQSASVYRAKNHDYGDSFAKSVQKRGFIAALTRIEDKFQRIDNIIITGKIEVKSESLEDSLLDMSNYCIMTVIELRRQKEEKKEYSKSVG